jgi:hypothetical protein
MKWTTELPTEEGWYWMQRGDTTEVVRIAMLGSDMDTWQKPMLHIYSPSLPGSAPVVRAEFSKAKWAGPITPPSEE